MSLIALYHLSKQWEGDIVTAWIKQGTLCLQTESFSFYSEGHLLMDSQWAFNIALVINI